MKVTVASEINIVFLLKDIIQGGRLGAINSDLKNVQCSCVARKFSWGDETFQGGKNFEI